MTRHVTIGIECNGCGVGTGPYDNDIPVDEVDTGVFPGWSQVLARRVIPNPDYKAPRTAEQIGADMVRGVPPAEQQAAMASVMPIAEQQARAELETTEPTHITDEVELHFCITCTPNVLTSIAVEEFTEAEWIQPAPPTPPPVQEVRHCRSLRDRSSKSTVLVGLPSVDVSTIAPCGYDRPDPFPAAHR